MNLSFMQSKIFWKKNAVKLTKKNKGTAVSQEFLCQHTVQLGSTFISIPHIVLITNLDAVLMFSFNSFFHILNSLYLASIQFETCNIKRNPHRCREFE